MSSSTTTKSPKTQADGTVFIRNLSFRTNNLGVQANLLLTFDTNISGLYVDRYPVVWRVMEFPKDGPSEGNATYQSQLAFAKPQVSNGNIVSVGAWKDLNVGQETTLKRESQKVAHQVRTGPGYISRDAKNRFGSERIIFEGAGERLDQVYPQATLDADEGLALHAGSPKALDLARLGPAALRKELGYQDARDRSDKKKNEFGVIEEHFDMHQQASWDTEEELVKLLVSPKRHGENETYSFTEPKEGEPGYLKGINGTNLAQDLSIGFDNGQGGAPTSVLYFKNVGATYFVEAQFTPILRAYITTNYQETEILRGAIQSPCIWHANLAGLDANTAWNLTYNPATADYAITAVAV